MEYISTRNSQKNFSFKDVFLKGLAPDGGLFVPKKIPSYNYQELEKLKNLSYEELAVKIILKFCNDEFNEKEVKDLVKISYKNFRVDDVVTIKKLGKVNILELFHGPTLAFKDIAMQVIGNIYNQFNSTDKKTVNIIVATSDNTGSAAISALSDKSNINVFVLHPHNKISNIQRKIMTTIGSSNVYNIAIKGSFDDCQKIVKNMFNENEFREKINMSGVNSINWARIICQIVYYFYAAFKFNNKKINFAVPTGNFGDVYAGYIAKKMGLGIDKLIVATNENDILKRVINTGEYKPDQAKPSFSPSMDIQVSSNFERLLFNIAGEDDKRVFLLMNELSVKGFFKLSREEIGIIKKDFCAEKINDKDTLSIIKDIDSKSNFVLDPHTATAVGAAKKINDLSSTIVLGTAHPYKFLETVKMATGKEVQPPMQLSKIANKEERYDVLENNISKIKDYILEKIA